MTSDAAEQQTLLPPEGTRTSAHSEHGYKRLLILLGLSFFLFGLINNVLYVIILSAALDLVPPSTPKGLILFSNITPGLLAKLTWPYLLKGRIHYSRRLVACSALTVSGMVVVAAFDGLGMRLLGIACASFSSGLGELTFLQLSTRYNPPSVAGQSVGYFASGTGAAGLVGAFLWWELRSLGVRLGVGLSSMLPLVIPLTYFFLLPRPAAFAHADLPPSLSHSSAADAPLISPAVAYVPLPTSDGNASEEVERDREEVEPEEDPKRSVALTLSASDKWRLVKPMWANYMLPLFTVYLFEYTINQGIAPTLVYPVPNPSEHWLMSKFIHSIRDYYPLWQLVYQTTVFVSRSTLSLGLPPLPARLIPLPSFVQACILAVLALEAARGIFDGDGVGRDEARAFALVFILVSLEGICGGLAYVNVYHRINQEQARPGVEPERAKQEREFKIGAVGLADGTGILLASLLSMPTEVGLCRAQVARGKTLCHSL